MPPASVLGVKAELQGAELLCDQPGHDAEGCIDGSRATGCTCGYGDSNRLSVRLAPGTYVGFVAVYVFGTSRQTNPFEIWLSDEAGASTGTERHRCGAPVDRDGPPPVVVFCGRTARFVTVKQVKAGDTRFFLSEVGVYTRSRLPALLPPAPPPPPPGQTMVQAINARFNADKRGGVLLHSFDNYEDWASKKPWQMYRRCRQNTDHLCGSLVSNELPCAFYDPGLGSLAAGLVFSDVANEGVLCGYDRDAATFHEVRGGCDSCAAHDGCFLPSRFSELLARQASFKHNEVSCRLPVWPLSRASPLVTTCLGCCVLICTFPYSEVSLVRCSASQIVLDGEYHDTHLPGVIAAFYYADVPHAGTTAGRRTRSTLCGGMRAPTDTVQKVRTTHSSFLERFGLTAEQVPLLRYMGAAGFELDQLD